MIRLENLNKSFGEFAALKNINLHISKGETVALIGASGSGKSTLLSIIGGMLKPTSGDVVVDGARLAKIPDNHAALFRRSHIGFIFQKYNLIGDLSVFENIAALLSPTDLSFGEVEALVQKAMELFHISHKKEEIVKNLSGGEQQRCAIARAVVNNPKIILADEPTANIDLSLKSSFLERLGELKELGKTILVATHDEMVFESTLFDRKIKIDSGSLIDSPKESLSQHGYQRLEPESFAISTNRAKASRSDTLGES